MKWPWRRPPKRTNWITCPRCGHDLNGDDYSFIREEGAEWLYKCAGCAHLSRFSLAYPIPVLIADGGDS
ncbi:hypothetical protein SEA_WHITNEY_62 [Gordonia phage Whitney]|nr:hypothetical protein SEA_WHITNEY_62 [Gordonia phage Whitney]